MYNIFYKSSDGPLHKATLPTMEAAREMHNKLLEAGWEVLTEFPH